MRPFPLIFSCIVACNGTTSDPEPSTVTEDDDEWLVISGDGSDTTTTTEYESESPSEEAATETGEILKFQEFTLTREDIEQLVNDAAFQNPPPFLGLKFEDVVKEQPPALVLRKEWIGLAAAAVAVVFCFVFNRSE